MWIARFPVSPAVAGVSSASGSARRAVVVDAVRHTCHGSHGCVQVESGKTAPSTSPTSPSPTGSAFATLRPPSSSRGKKRSRAEARGGGGDRRLSRARGRRLSPVDVGDTRLARSPFPGSETRDSETRDGEPRESVDRGDSADRPRSDAPALGPVKPPLFPPPQFHVGTRRVIYLRREILARFAGEPVRSRRCRSGANCV